MICRDVSDKILELVTILIPSKVDRATHLLEREVDVKFLITALHIYYKLSKENKDDMVDINDEWINQIALSLNYARTTVYTKIHTILKPCLAGYMNMPSYSRKIKHIMMVFYDRYMSKW
ncbi:MAG: hypothetical protein J6C46_12615 [Clostridia bacterium]|nr:hypothetical protein [Clostridia bacterium]